MAIAVPVHAKFTSTPEILIIVFFAGLLATDIAEPARRKRINTVVAAANVSTVGQAAQAIAEPARTKSMKSSAVQKFAAADRPLAALAAVA